MIFFTKHDWCWRLDDGRIWSTEKAAFVSDAEAKAWATARGLEGIPPSPVDEKGLYGVDGLRDALVFYGLPLGELAEGDQSASKLK